jgi:hypothetical protein
LFGVFVQVFCAHASVVQATLSLQSFAVQQPLWAMQP